MAGHGCRVARHGASSAGVGSSYRTNQPVWAQQRNTRLRGEWRRMRPWDTVCASAGLRFAGRVCVCVHAALNNVRQRPPQLAPRTAHSHR